MSGNSGKRNSNETELPIKKAKNDLSGFVRGSIIRIKVKNFLTYNSVEMHPGPNLNLIIGPNGTGKSTIVCAICLGLAGKPSVLGRAGNIADYIQNGFQKALIEIDLYSDGASKCCISREISKVGSTNWFLNGKSSNLKAVEAMVKSMNIQVHNLCQFLPQDRVAEFAKMTPQELLEDTQKAVGLAEMFDKHVKLKKLRSQQREIEASTRTSTDQLDKEIERNKRLEQEVRNYQEREEYLKTIELLKKKRHWVEYNTKRELYTNKKKELFNNRNELNKIKAENEPIKNRLRELSLVVDDINNETRTLSTSFSSLFENIKSKNRSIDHYIEKVGEVDQDLKVKKQDEEMRINRITELKKHLLGMESELSKYEEDKDEIQAKLNKNAEELQTVTVKVSQIQNDIVHFEQKRQSLGHELKAFEFEIKRIQDTGSKQLDILRLKSNDAFRAVQWLRKNNDRFKGKIYEPILTTIIMHDIKNAKFLETHIPFRDMLAFVCENPDDLDQFMKVVKDEMKLRVNAVLVPKESLESFNSAQPIANLSRWGFQVYLKDLFSAPVGVMRYLCRMYRVHDIPVGNQHTELCLDRIFKETNLSRFYTPSRVYSSKQSKHGNRVRSTMSQDLRQADMLTVSVDTEKLAQLNKLSEDLKKQISDLLVKIENLKQEEREVSIDREKCRKVKKELLIQQSYRKTLCAQISQKKRMIQESEKISSIDLKKEESEAYEKINFYNKNKLDIGLEILELVKKRLSLAKEKIRLAFKSNITVKRKLQAEQDLVDASAASKALEESVNELMTEVSKLKIQATKLLEAAQKATGIAVAGRNLLKSIEEAFGNLPQTLEEIDEKINQEQARADCMCQVDKSVIQEFMNRKKDIERMEKESQSSKSNMESLQKDIDHIRDEWLPQLEELLERINYNFSEFFSRLSCVGEVSLKTGENPIDFEKYGVCIKVKFRKAEALHELSAFHQSGGERSVATVLYMMAMQELTKVPFRCVDEINQGMDAINERKVFEFVVETACRKNTSQYFLLTPKLLSNLTYSDNMKHHIINNGAGILLEWNMKKFICIAKKVVDDDQRN